MEKIHTTVETVADIAGWDLESDEMAGISGDCCVHRGGQVLWADARGVACELATIEQMAALVEREDAGISGAYTYTFFDANPVSSGQCSWPSHEGIEIEAEDDDEAVRLVREALAAECAGLVGSDDYPTGSSVWALVWGADGSIVGQISHEIEGEAESLRDA